MFDPERFEGFVDSLTPDLPEPLASLEEAALAASVPIIRRGTQSLLAFLLQAVRPQRILEVGAAVGFSALFMKQYMPGGCHITTIERDEERIREARRNLASFDPEGRITLLSGDASEVMAGLAEGEFDFIFMDAAKGQYPVLLEPALKLLRVGGVLVSDNVLQEGDILESRFFVPRRDRTIHSRMREYLYTLTHSPSLQTVILQEGDGTALTVKRDATERDASGRDATEKDATERDATERDASGRKAGLGDKE